MLAFLTAILAVAKPVMDEVYFNSVMHYVNQYVDNEKQIEAERANWPDVDDAKLSELMKQRMILEDALAKQAAVIQLKPTTA